MHYLPGPAETRAMTTEQLRAAFLVQGLFQPGAVALRHIDLDRVVLGGAVPTEAPLALEAPESLGAEFFLERRELGVLNVGGAGTVTVDGASHALGKRDVLYVGRGSREVVFESDDAARPARFYLVSYPAHEYCPTAPAPAADAEGGEMGSAASANRRRIARYIHLNGVRSAQLVMGVTVLAEGSVWNTMPAHTHHRRTEVYLYFDLPEEERVVHLCGEPQSTRSLVLANRQAVISPPWSIHTGAGTAPYKFVWSTAGENLAWDDMDPVATHTLT